MKYDVAIDASFIKSLCIKNNTRGISYNFIFNDLKLVVMYFLPTNNLLISVKDHNIAWFSAISPYNTIDTLIPREAFLLIKDHLNFVANTNRHSTIDFFKELAIAATITSNYHLIPDININLAIAHTASSDTEHDKDNHDKPFFSHFIIHNSRHVTSWNLKKTKRVLGTEAAAYCSMYNVSSVWSSIPTTQTVSILMGYRSYKDFL